MEAGHLLGDLPRPAAVPRLAGPEEEIERSPMERMRLPQVPESPVPVLTEKQPKTLLASCDSKDFVGRRDTAIIRLLLDTGCRRAEIANLTTTDVSLEERDIAVIGKGSRVRILPFGLKLHILWVGDAAARSRPLGGSAGSVAR